MTTPIQDLRLDIRKTWFSNEPGALDFTDDNLDTGILDGLNEYSRFRPRRNRLGNITITSGSRYADLPTDFLSAELIALFYGMTGINLSQTVVRYYGALSIFDSELSATLYPPPNVYASNYFADSTNGLVPTGGNPFVVSLTTSDLGNWQLLLPDTPTANSTREITYNAVHIVNDTKKTIPDSDRDILKDLVIGKTCLVMKRSILMQEESTVEQKYVADNWAKLSDNYIKRATKKMAFLGTRG